MAERIGTLVNRPIDWAYLVASARVHQIAPLVYKHLGGVCRDVVPEDAWAQLKSLYYAHAIRSVRLGTEELPALLQACERQEIPVIPFKGPVLGALVYNDLSLRSFGDLDILIREEDAPHVHELLTARGYRREASYNFESAYSSVIGGIPFEVDVHWQIADPIHPIRIDYDRLWSRTRPSTIAGADTRTFAPEDLLIVLGIHGSKHGWACMKWLCDVAEALRVLDDVEWDRVIERAHRMRCERMVLLGLSLARRLLGAPLPEQVRKRVREVASIKKLEAPVIGNLFAENPAVFSPYWRKRVGQDSTFLIKEYLFFLRLEDQADSQSDFLRLAHQVVTPTEYDQAYVSLPDALSFLYYLVRPVRLMRENGKVGKSILKSLLGWR